jgi:hypothetical protein
MTALSELPPRAESGAMVHAAWRTDSAAIAVARLRADGAYRHRDRRDY